MIAADEIIIPCACDIRLAVEENIIREQIERVKSINKKTNKLINAIIIDLAKMMTGTKTCIEYFVYNGMEGDPIKDEDLCDRGRVIRNIVKMLTNAGYFICVYEGTTNHRYGTFININLNKPLDDEYD